MDLADILKARRLNFVKLRRNTHKMQKTFTFGLINNYKTLTLWHQNPVNL